MRRLLNVRVRTSQELKRFRDKMFHNMIWDHKRDNDGEYPDIYNLEAEMLVRDVMDRLSFLRPAVKAHHGNGCVEMQVGIYSDQQHDLDRFAYSVGIRGWKPAVLIYYALKMEDERCGRRS